MKAYQLFNVNNLKCVETDLPEIKSGWCLVKVKACGICSSDIPRIFKNGTYHFPTIPGHEFSGVVEVVADEENKFLTGQKVGVFPLIPCQKCYYCKQQKYEMCSSYDYIGSRRDGAFAEYVAVPIWNLILLEGKNITFNEAAMIEPLAVALHAVKKAKITTKSRIAIIGTGLIGFAIAQWCKYFGAESVDIIGRSNEKQNYAKKIGVNYLIANFEKLRNKYNVVFEVVGTNNAIETALDIAKPEANVVLIGNPEDDIKLSQKNYWSVLRKQLTLIGSWNSSFGHSKESDWYQVVEAISNKALNPEILISNKYKCSELFNALELMRNHKKPYCKVMIEWN